MYTLILIVTFIANGAAIDIAHIPFNTKTDCQEALIKIMQDTSRGEHRNTLTTNASLDVRAYCVAKG